MTISRSTRSGGLFSMLRRAAAPSRATLSLYSSRRAWTRMSIFVFASSTMRMRLSERSFTSAAPGSGFERALQLRLGIGEGVALDSASNSDPARRVEQAGGAHRDVPRRTRPPRDPSLTAAWRAAPPPRETGPGSSAPLVEPELTRRTRLHRALCEFPPPAVRARTRPVARLASLRLRSTDRESRARVRPRPTERSSRRRCRRRP